MSAMATEDYTEADYAAEFDSAANDVAAKTVTAVLAAFAAWQAGQVTTAVLTAMLGKILTSGNVYATVMGDLVATRALTLLAARPYLPTGVAGEIDLQAELLRLSDAAATITAALDSGKDPKARLERIARSESVNALQQAVVATLARHGVTGYVRGTDSDPCELCVWLKKEHLRPGGFVYPTDKPMHRHPGCQCVPIPVLDAPVYKSGRKTR